MLKTINLKHYKVDPVNSVLVDSRNIDVFLPLVISKVKTAPYTGFDLETHNGNAHEGIKKLNSEGKNVFDIRRTVVTGFSVYPEGDNLCYYINLNHRDTENRIPYEKIAPLLEEMQKHTLIIHNAQFEKIMMRMCYNYEIFNYIDTLQLCVSAYSSDSYSFDKFCSTDLGEIRKLLPAISQAFENWDGYAELNPKQAELVGQVCGKQSEAAHSYNGFLKSVSIGYGLKQAVKSFFGYEMEHYDECLNKSEYARKRAIILKDKKYAHLRPYVQEETHMGHLTGEEVVSYGADDAYWCVQLYKALYDFIQENCPSAWDTFFLQENKMADIFTNIQSQGLRIDLEAVYRKRDDSRKEAAHTLKAIKTLFRELLPFPSEPSEELLKSEAWYRKNWQKYRKQIVDFAYAPDFDDSPEGVMNQILQINGGITKSYTEDVDLKKNPGIINLVHYMPSRTIYYDLMGHKALKSKGKIQSGKESRGKMLENYDKDTPQNRLLQCMNKLTQIDQVCKLYLNPYLYLTDPETSRIYPSISSTLATRRMSMSNPNPQQLSKRGESTYVRGFYLPDNPERQVIMSADWSAVELVIPGELSLDPEFVRCYSVTPPGDLHSAAAAAMLNISLEDFKAIKHLPEETVEYKGVHLINTKGEQLSPAKFYKWARTELGKGANFSYWYSGALSNLQEKLGWTDEEHWAKVEAYRQKFPVAEKWRLDTIDFAIQNGYVDLPDGHRRYKFETTSLWAEIMQSKFLSAYDSQGVRNFLRKFIKLTQTRARNQSVNSKIQGTAAALAKRAMWNLQQEIEKRWTPDQVRIMVPVHDEIVASVDCKFVLEYRDLVKRVMCDQPWLMKVCKLNSSVSMGRTFEPFDKEKAPLGQIELDEAPEVDWLPEEVWGKIMSDEDVLKALDYQFSLK
jgi:DNA polymerase I-like protein with 3'-5' exonuclease and polymerase domains